MNIVQYQKCECEHTVKLNKLVGCYKNKKFCMFCIKYRKKSWLNINIFATIIQTGVTNKKFWTVFLFALRKIVIWNY